MSNTAPSRADLLADGAHHKKPHSPTHPLGAVGELAAIMTLMVMSSEHNLFLYYMHEM